MKAVAMKSVELDQKVERLFEEIRGLGLRINLTSGDGKRDYYFEIEDDAGNRFLDSMNIRPRTNKETGGIVGYTLSLAWKPPGGSCEAHSYPTRPDGSFKYDKIAAEIARRYRATKSFLSRRGIEEVIPDTILIADLIREYGPLPSFLQLSAGSDPNRVKVSFQEIELDQNQVKVLLLAGKAIDE